MSRHCVHRDELDGRVLEIYEVRALVGAPPVPAVVEIYYVWEAPAWPIVRIRARRFGRRLMWWLRRQPSIELENAEFNQAFHVDAEDEEFAVGLLTPALQAFLLTKRGVDWRIGDGEIRLYYRGRLRRSRIPRSLDRLRGFWEHVGPELRTW